VLIPVGAPLKAALAATPRRSPLMLVNQDGVPWSPDGFRVMWRKTCKRAGIDGVTFHDLRGTVVTRLALAGCTEPEIVSLTGHTMAKVPRSSTPTTCTAIRVWRARRSPNGRPGIVFQTKSNPLISLRPKASGLGKTLNDFNDFLRTLTPSILVRIQVPQPTFAKRQKSNDFKGLGLSHTI
jgi:hypothetical protein